MVGVLQQDPKIGSVRNTSSPTAKAATVYDIVKIKSRGATIGVTIVYRQDNTEKLHNKKNNKTSYHRVKEKNKIDE